MGLPAKLRFWRFYSNPIRQNYFSIIKWGLTQTFGKIRNAFTIVQPESVADRIEVYRKYDELQANGKTDLPTVALVEEMVATDITEALRAEGIRVFPPVLFKASLTPKFLIVSKRAKIGRISPDPLIRPELTAVQRQELESFVEKNDPSLSAYVADLGGISLFPPIVHLYPVQTLIEVAAHEWCHTHLFFSPLGLFYFATDRNIASINEITCTILGKGIIRRVQAKYGWEEKKEDPPQPEKKEDRPNYGRMLHAIRKQVDDFLREGKVTDAGIYMREATSSLRKHWPNHLKLSTAYFAFYGNYGGGAAGTDPTARQLGELRQKSGSLKNFLKKLRRISSRENFEKLLKEERIS